MTDYSDQKALYSGSRLGTVFDYQPDNEENKENTVQNNQQQQLRSNARNDNGRTQQQQHDHEKRKLKETMNKWEWTQELDKALQETVLRNYFNFDMVAVELNQAMNASTSACGGVAPRALFTNEKCRMRWSYLHLKRQTGKQVKYKQQSSSGIQEEEARQKSPIRQFEHHKQFKSSPQKNKQAQEVIPISEPQKDLDSKSFDNMVTINKDKVTLGNLEGQLWKKNVTSGPRKRKDYLDVSQEDFTKNVSLSVDGREIIPSNFNIFRDSLRQNSEQLLRTLQENLPDMNLQEIEQLGDDDEEDDEEEVLPLDFRTALIEEENKVVIQAKPLNLKTDDDLLKIVPEPENMEEDKEFASVESYLEAVKKEPFNHDEGNVILIDPDIKIKEKFEAIDLACNVEQRINNTLNAPVRTPEQIALAEFARQMALQTQLQQAQQVPKKQSAPHVASKQYETDTDNEKEEEKTAQLEQAVKPENMPHGFKKENLDFNNILKQWGVNDLGSLLGMSSEDDEGKKKKRQKEEVKKLPASLQAKPPGEKEAMAQDRNVAKRVGLIESIMNENRKAQAKKAEAENKPLSMEDMLEAMKGDAAALQSEEDSDVAPMSALVDAPTKEELQRQQLKRAQKSVQLAAASSQSESEQSASENKGKKKPSQQQPQKKRVTFQGISSASEKEEEVEMIDTSSKPKNQGMSLEEALHKQPRGVSLVEALESGALPTKDYAAKISRRQKGTPANIQYKGQMVTSDQEADDGEAKKESAGESSQDSADEYFNQQRKAIRNRMLGDQRLQNEFDKEDYNSGGEQDPAKRFPSAQGDNRFTEEGDMFGDDMNDFDQMMQQSLSESQRLQEEELRKAKEEQERMRIERLKLQEENLRREQERKQKERDELMERLKRQDEERKKRKKEEKIRKEQERELQRRQEEELRQREEEEREKIEEAERKRRIEEARVKKEKEDNERRKEHFEASIRKVWNGSDIPCLFDSKIAYSRQLYSLPVDLEDKILKNEVPNEDIMFRRYKVLLIPVDALLSHTSGRPLIELTNYFLRYSTLPLSDNRPQTSDEEFHHESIKSFPFKCIGFVETVAVPPFNKCSLSPVSQSENPNAQRVLTLLFDTHDRPKQKHNFNDTLRMTKLTDILSLESMVEIKQIYPQYLEKMASDFLQSNKLKEFPYKVTTNPILSFENKSDLVFDSCSHSQECLNRISFFMEYAVQDDTVPMATKESWEFLRRYPTFYAYNPNSRSYSRIDSRDRIVTKYNQFKEENVCVIFKDLSIGKVYSKDYTQTTTSEDSLTYFLKKATIQHGLELCGMRLIYLDDQQIQLYEHLFNERLSEQEPDRAVLALFLRGVDAISKCEGIVGHFNPDMARKTNEKSVRAFFGRDKEHHNCVLKMFASQKKNLSELIFWFGGRVQQEAQTLEILQQAQQVPVSTMYLVVPPRIEKQYLFLSPLITARELPRVLQVLCEFGVTVLDIQKINYEKLAYEGEGLGSLNRNLCLFKVRGSTLLIPVGFVIKVAREGLVQKYKCKVANRIEKLLDNLDRMHGELIYMTQGEKEQKILRQKLRQSIFNVNYSQLQIEHLKPQQKKHLLPDGTVDPASRTDYDSEDTENFKDIALFNHEHQTTASPVKKKTLIHTTTAAQSKSVKEETYETQTFMCFLKVSLFRKQVIGDILAQILSPQTTQFELVGLKIVNCKREIYNELVPVEVRTVFKKLAYRFYEGHPDLRLRKKITEFKTLVLVLRGRNVESSIAKIYDLERLKFLNSEQLGLFEGQPQALFLTNHGLLDPMFDFLLSTKIIKLYNDFALSHEHIMDSPAYSYMLHHNVEKIDPALASLIPDAELAEKAMSASNIVQIKSKEQLTDRQDAATGRLSACICVVKPNQSLNVALRTLKSIVNNKELGLSIQNLEFVLYDERQLDLLYSHDIEYDEMIPEHLKPVMKEQFYALFRESNHPVVQFLVSGPYAIAKIKQIIGHKDPKLAKKESMRSFYGVDRVDNAYFISENFSESLIERDFLFSTSQVVWEPQIKRAIKQKEGVAQPKPSGAPLLAPHLELALVLFSPSIVQSNDFVFVLEDLQRSKFNICAILKHHYLERSDLELLFQEQVPRLFNLEALENLEFKKEGSGGGCVLVVVEKEKAVSELSELVGRLEIKSKNDYEKYKKRSQSSSSSSTALFSTYQQDQQSLVAEYGPYIYAFPIGGAAANQRKILKYFNSLPNSQHFEIEDQSDK